MTNQRSIQFECDACHTVSPVQAQAEQTLEGEVQFFVCPSCAKRYDFARITPAGLALRPQIALLRQALRRSNDPRLNARLNALVARFQAEVHDLTRRPAPVV